MEDKRRVLCRIRRKSLDLLDAKHLPRIGKGIEQSRVLDLLSVQRLLLRKVAAPELLRNRHHCMQCCKVRAKVLWKQKLTDIIIRECPRNARLGADFLAFNLHVQGPKKL